MLNSTYSTRKRYLCQPTFISIHWNGWIDVWLVFFMFLVGIVRLQKHWELILKCIFPSIVYTSLKNIEIKPQQWYFILKKKEIIMAAFLQAYRIPLFRLNLTNGIKREGKLLEKQMNCTMSFCLLCGKDWELFKTTTLQAICPSNEVHSLCFWGLQSRELMLKHHWHLVLPSTPYYWLLCPLDVIVTECPIISSYTSI